MELGSLRTSQLSDAGYDWYLGYLRALDDFDIDRYGEHLADDVTVQFNNDEPLVGKEAATAGLSAYWSSIRDAGFTLVHEPLNIYGTDGALVMEALNHYERAGNDRITVRAVAFTDRNADGDVTSVRLYQDMSPVFGD